MDNATTSDDFDYLDEDKGLMVVEIVYLAIVSLFGTLGNALVIGTILYKRMTFKNAHMFILNLAIADLLVSFVNISESIVIALSQTERVRFV